MSARDQGRSSSIPDAAPRRPWSDRRDAIGIVVVLVVIWFLLWGEVSVANLVSGVVAATLLLVAFPIDRDVIAVRHRLRPLAAAHLALFITSDLLRSTIGTAADVLRIRSQVRTGIIACPLRVDNDGLVTFLANVIALSPGTMPIEVTYRPHVLYVHSLHASDPERIRAFVARLEELAVRAVGGPAAVGAVAAPAPWPPAPDERTTAERPR